MDDNPALTPSSRIVPYIMASSKGANGYPVSAAMLMDPKAMKKHLANGISSSHFESSPGIVRQSSEPLPSFLSTKLPSTAEDSLRVSKDDAYEDSMNKGKNSASGPQVGSTPSSQSEARRLLDPIGFDTLNRKRVEQEYTVESSSSPQRQPANGPSHQLVDSNVSKRDFDECEGPGIGSLIERVHNISQRGDRPSKKQKTGPFEDEDNDNKAKFGGGGKGGDLGEYIKEKKKEGISEYGSVNSVVDLTGGDSPVLSFTTSSANTFTADDDEIVIVSDSQEREVCYGRIGDTKVQAHQLPTPSGKAMYLSKGQWPAMKLLLRRHPGKDYIIRVIDPMGKDVGNVDIRTSQALSKIMDSRNPKFRTQARLNARVRKNGDYPGKECSEYFDMTVNLYGPRHKAVVMGRFLSQKNIWLRQPFMVDAGIEIFNPHQPAIAPPRTVNGIGAHASSATGPGTGYVSRTNEEITREVTGLFDSLQQTEHLPEMDADPRIITELLSHQKQGLYFMTNKEKERVFSDSEEENNSLWRLNTYENGRRTYYNVITGQEERTKPPEVLGGILADMMGLGKTLSILSLVVGTLNEAKQWGERPAPEMDGEKPLIRNSKSTLLVSPLSTVANWEEQIATHVKEGTLKYYIYHGANRISDLNELAKYDIVITTYSIVSSEFTGRGKRKGINPLLQTNFFRIVLDEAHMIREQSTRQSQAICTLSAQRRWAVTGTPVQNKLDDLGALIKFLRIKPFNEKGGFAQFIMSPFKNADPEVIPKLRLLVDSITLRRLKDRIDLPGRHDQIVRLTFSEDERNLYQWFATDSQNKLKIITSDQKKSLGGRTYAHILRAIMRLRLICAHGRELLSEDDLKITEGFSQGNAINLDDDDEEDNRAALSPKLAYEMLMLFRETDSDSCAQCSKKIEISESEDTANGKDDIIGCMLPCYQMLCKDCMEGVKASIEQHSVDHRFKCPFCEVSQRTSFFDLTKEGIEAAEDARAEARQNPRQAKIMGRYGGPHTKVKALLDSLRESENQSKTLPSGEHPIKSVVFSGWTANLDLIQIALEDNGIKYVRLDGKMSRKNRNSSLEAFRDDPAVCVILISITAGGLGLNLTTGSKVYVMEPQFNPAAEAQAVDRVHRLGQKREVFTYRYIMDDSFEDKMLDLQRKKQSLADLSMNRGKLDKAEAAKRKLDELKSLFK